MKKFSTRILPVTGLVLIATTAQAADKPLMLDPNAAYVVVEVTNLVDQGFKGTKVPGSLILARYDPVKGDVRGGYRSPDTVLPKDQPVRITFAGKPLIKSKTSRLFFAKLEPDTWVVEGSNATSFALGSLRFEVKPGQLIDLGVMTPSPDYGEGEGATPINAGTMLKMTTIGQLFGGGGMPRPKQVKLDWHIRTATDLALPALLSTVSATPASFTYGASFGNYLGGLVNRIDGRAGRGRPVEVPPPPAVPVTPATP
jgi:hypothetical protein